MSIDLAELGITKEELQERVIQTIANDLLMRRVQEVDEDGEPFEDMVPTSIKTQLEKIIKDRVDEQFRILGEKYVQPKLAEIIPNLVLTKTNEWGEKKGSPITLVEYLVQRAEAYMMEQVNTDGKNQKEESFSWRPSGTRLSHAVNKYLMLYMEDAMKQIVNRGNSILVEGIEAAMKAKLREIAESLNVTVKAK